MVDLVVRFVFHHHIDGHITGLGAREDAEIVGVKRAEVRVVSVVVQQGQRLILTGQHATVGRGDTDAGRGAEVFVDLDAQGVLSGHQGGAVIEFAIVVKHGQGRIGQQGVFGDLEGVSTETCKDFTVKVPELVGDGHGVPYVAVNIGWNGELTGERVTYHGGGVDILKDGFPSIAFNGGNIVLVGTEGLAVMAPNGVGFVVLILVEPFEADEVHGTDGVGVLDPRGVGGTGVFEGHLEVILNQSSVVIGAVDVAVESF